MTLADAAPRITDAPDLHDYDVVLVNSSAGKDSQSMLTAVVELADAQELPRQRIVVVHADLGRVEWEGTRELAETQAKAYGLRFEVVRRTKGDLLDQIEGRGMFPSSTARYCTSDQKVAQVAKLITRLAADHRAAGNTDPIRILNCLGIRAQESPARAKKVAFGPDRTASNGRRTVTRWLPIFDWTVEQVWATIRHSGLPYHSAYDAGMSRLSCCMCVLSGRRELVIAARLNPALAREYVRVEDKIGHTFQAKTSIREIATEAGVLEPVA